MPSSWKLSHMWIDDIPDSKLEGGIGSGSIYKDANFRLDMQGLTTAKDGEPQKLNIQMQANKHAPVSSIRKLAPGTVAEVRITVMAPYTAADIKSKPHESLNQYEKDYKEGEAAKIEARAAAKKKK
jgi:hypothetical protein